MPLLSYGNGLSPIKKAAQNGRLAVSTWNGDSVHIAQLNTGAGQMAINVRKAARFVRVRGSHANIMNESVDVLFDGEDGNTYAIEIDHSIISALLAAILGESRELHSSLPALVDGPTQALQSTGVSVSMASDGSLAWRISLEGDIHFDLAFSSDQFESLDRQMNDVRDLLRRRQ